MLNSIKLACSGSMLALVRWLRKSMLRLWQGGGNEGGKVFFFFFPLLLPQVFKQTLMLECVFRMTTYPICGEITITYEVKRLRSGCLVVVCPEQCELVSRYLMDTKIAVP